MNPEFEINKIKLTTSEKVCGVFLAAILVFCFFTMEYTDGLENAGMGYALCHGLFTNTFMDVYNSSNFSYGISIYSIYAIWSIPLVIIDLICGRATDMQTAGAGYVYWYKLLLVLFWIACLVVIYRIVKEYYDELNTVQILLLLMSFSMMAFPVFAMTQCDVMGMFFSLLGIRSLLQKKDIRFVVFFAVAITMKYFALFIFIPLVLYRFRGIKVIGAGLGGISLAALSLLLVHSSQTVVASYSDDSYYVVNYYEKLYDSWKLIAYYAVVCVTAIAANVKGSEENFRKWISWFCFAGFCTLLVYYSPNPYWYILIMPYMVLLLYNNTKYTKLNLILSILFSNAALLNRVMVHTWVFGGRYMFMLLTGENRYDAYNCPDPLYSLFAGGMEGMGLRPWLLYQITRAIVYLTSMALVVINIPSAPWNRIEDPAKTMSETKAAAAEKTVGSIPDVSLIRVATVVNIAILYIWTALCLVTRTITGW